MYFWNLSRLREDLASDRVSKKDRVLYLLFTLVCGYPIALRAIDIKASNSWLAVGLALGQLIALAAGVFYCYGKAGRANAKNFTDQFLALSWVIGIRFVVVILLGTAIIGTVLMLSIKGAVVGGNLLFLLVGGSLVLVPALILLYAFFFYLIGKNFELLPKDNQAAQSEEGPIS